MLDRSQCHYPNYLTLVVIRNVGMKVFLVGIYQLKSHYKMTLDRLLQGEVTQGKRANRAKSGRELPW
ncbi:unnamed protein product, partial [Ceratitis capitata]